ncbi:MAG: hypothetical protein RLQ73_07805 [Hoeflea sp. D1-CHI-28]
MVGETDFVAIFTSLPVIRPRRSEGPLPARYFQMLRLHCVGRWAGSEWSELPH